MAMTTALANSFPMRSLYGGRRHNSCESYHYEDYDQHRPPGFLTPTVTVTGSGYSTGLAGSAAYSQYQLQSTRLPPRSATSSFQRVSRLHVVTPSTAAIPRPAIVTTLSRGTVRPASSALVLPVCDSGHNDSINLLSCAKSNASKKRRRKSSATARHSSLSSSMTTMAAVSKPEVEIQSIGGDMLPSRQSVVVPSMSVVFHNLPDNDNRKIGSRYPPFGPETTKSGLSSVGHATEAFGRRMPVKGPYRIRINVCGLVFETDSTVLDRHPSTLLGDRRRRLRYYDAARDELFLDRHRPSFEAVFIYYQTGSRLRRPLNVPDDVFLEELIFYQLESEVIRQYKISEGCPENESPPPVSDGTLTGRLWILFEFPETSNVAFAIGIVSVMMTLVSIVLFCVETLPYFAESHCVEDEAPNFLDPFFIIETVCDVISSEGQCHTNDAHLSVKTSGFQPFDEPRLSRKAPNALERVSACEQATLGKSRSGSDYLSLDAGHRFHQETKNEVAANDVNNICTLWFTLEIIVRLVGCPSKFAFLKDVKNAIDVTAILPYYVTFFNVVSTMSCASAKSSASLAFLRVTRLIRIFKLTKHSVGLQVLLLTFRASVEGLALFLVALFVGLLVFSSAIYYAELGQGEQSQIHSIPDGFWWAIITMTTVGYGDKVPLGPVGKLVGAACAICGVLTLAIPVPIITGHFNRFYAHKTGRGKNI